VYTQSQPPYYPPYNPPTSNLSCTLTANPGAIQNGQSAVLSWTSYGAVSAWLSDGLGTVSTTGSLSVRPESSRNYVLTVRDAYGHQQTCNANLTVSGGLPYVSLTSIPYTGLDLGLVGSIAYWGALLAFAIGAAYVIVGYKGGVVGAVYTLTHAFNGSKDYDAVVLHETVTTRSNSQDSANEDIVADAVVSQGHSTDTMALEGDGDMPRIVIRRN